MLSAQGDLKLHLCIETDYITSRSTDIEVACFTLYTIMYFTDWHVTDRPVEHSTLKVSGILRIDLLCRY